LGAVRAGLINVLILDEEAAREVLREIAGEMGGEVPTVSPRGAA